MLAIGMSSQKLCLWSVPMHLTVHLINIDLLAVIIGYTTVVRVYKDDEDRAAIAAKPLDAEIDITPVSSGQQGLQDSKQTVSSGGVIPVDVKQAQYSLGSLNDRLCETHFSVTSYEEKAHTSTPLSCP